MKTKAIGAAVLIVSLIAQGVGVAPAYALDEAVENKNAAIENTEPLVAAAAAPVQPAAPIEVESIAPEAAQTTLAPIAPPQPEVAIPPATQVASPQAVKQVLPPPKGPIYISMFELHPENGFAFIELWNTSSEYEKLDNTMLDLEYTSARTLESFVCTVTLSGYIAPKTYVTLGAPEQAAAEQNVLSMGKCPNAGGRLVDISLSLRDAAQTVPDEKLLVPAPDVAQRYVRKSSSKTGVFETDFTKKPAATSTDVPRTSALYHPPTSMPLRITEVFMNPRLCASGDIDLTCRSYVKLVNDTDEPVDVSLYRLRSGKPGAASSVYNTSNITGVVPANGFLVISQTNDGKKLGMNSDEGATWFEDRLGFVTYANNDAPYEKAELAANRQRAWAYDDSDQTWKWATPSPATKQTTFYTPGMGGGESPTPIEEPERKPCAANQYRSEETNRCRLIVTTASTTTPCKEGQYRSEETNRCRSIASAAKSLTPCKEGQYRSEETNRCRSIASAAASVLKPCADDQFRSPATNRCKKIASTEEGLKPCKAGQERNPATNRCRNIMASKPTDAAFKVRPIEASTVSMMKWWALGAVLAGGAGYAVWQFRHEIIGAVRKIPHETRASK